MKKPILFILSFLFVQSVFAQSQSMISVRLNYATTTVGTVTPVTLIASTARAISKISVFDSCGQTMALKITDPGAVVTTMLIPPGGGDFPLNITTKSSVGIIGISGTCTVGEDDTNFFYN